MTTEPHHVWYSEIDADGKTNRKCEPFGIESEAEKYVAYLHTLDYVENVIIEVNLSIVEYHLKTDHDIDGDIA
jgi:hypothetical protein